MNKEKLLLDNIIKDIVSYTKPHIDIIERELLLTNIESCVTQLRFSIENEMRENVSSIKNNKISYNYVENKDNLNVTKPYISGFVTSMSSSNFNVLKTSDKLDETIQCVAKLSSNLDKLMETLTKANKDELNKVKSEDILDIEYFNTWTDAYH